MASSGKTLPKPRVPEGDGGSGRRSGVAGRLARQQRPARIVGSVMLVVFAVVGNMYLVHSFDRRVPVVVVARDVPVRQQISRADLTTARVAVDASVQTIPERQLAQVVGQHAVVGLRKGSLLSASHVTGAPYPRPGQTLVTVPLKIALVPPGLAPGWQVRVVSTPGVTPSQGGGTPEPGTDPPPIAAEVNRVGDPSTEGTVTVALVVAEGESVGIARQAAAGAVALIVTAQGG